MVAPLDAFGSLQPVQLDRRQLLVAALADAVDQRNGRDPLLRPLFPGKSFTCAIEAFAAFLAQFLGGPSEDSQRRWWLSLRESHLRFQIGDRERTAWLGNMAGACPSHVKKSRAR